MELIRNDGPTSTVDTHMSYGLLARLVNLDESV